MASLRSTYPMYFDTVAIPFPSTYNESANTIETVNKSEAGTDIVNVTRDDKLSISMTIKCLQPTVQAIGAFQTKPSFTFKRYQPKTGAYEERTVRMRNLSITLLKGSQDLTEVDGVWQMVFRLEEF